MSSRFSLALAFAFLLAASGFTAPRLLAAEHPALPAAPTPPAATPPAATPPGATPPGEADPLIARVNGRALRRSDVEAAARNLPEQARNLPFAKVYPVLLQRMINGELLVDAGYRAHLDRDPAVRQELARDEDHLVQRAYIDQIIKGVTGATLQARYQQYLKETPPQDEVRARQILVPTEAAAKSIIAQLDKGADFATLARKYSKDPGTDSAGDLGYFTRGQMVPAFAEAAFALQVGHYTPTPVKTEFGWHVIKVEDRRAAKPRSFAQMHDQLLSVLATELVNQKLDGLRKTAKIELFGPSGQPAPSAGMAPAAAPPAH